MFTYLDHFVYISKALKWSCSLVISFLQSSDMHLSFFLLKTNLWLAWGSQTGCGSRENNSSLPTSVHRTRKELDILKLSACPPIIQTSLQPSLRCSLRFRARDSA